MIPEHRIIQFEFISSIWKCLHQVFILSVKKKSGEELMFLITLFCLSIQGCVGKKGVFNRHFVNERKVWIKCYFKNECDNEFALTWGWCLGCSGLSPEKQLCYNSKQYQVTNLSFDKYYLSGYYVNLWFILMKYFLYFTAYTWSLHLNFNQSLIVFWDLGLTF